MIFLYLFVLNVCTIVVVLLLLVFFVALVSIESLCLQKTIKLESFLDWKFQLLQTE